MDGLNIVWLGAGIALLLLAGAGGTGTIARTLNINTRSFSRDERIGLGAIGVILLVTGLGLTLF